MRTVLNIAYSGDLYEIVLEEKVIMRVTKYPDGTGRREEKAFSDLPEPVIERVLKRMERVIS